MQIDSFSNLLSIDLTCLDVQQWMSPEQQERPEDELSTEYLNEKIDIYALGNILYKIAVGNSPWKVCLLFLVSDCVRYQLYQSNSFYHSGAL